MRRNTALVWLVIALLTAAADGRQVDPKQKSDNKQARLAIRLAPITRSDAEKWKLPAAGQPQVQFVVPGGGGDKIGLRRGDVILRVDGQETVSVAQATAALKKVALGRQVELLVAREGKEKTLTGPMETDFGDEEELRRSQQAAGQNPAGQEHVGTMYQTGRGTAKDEAEAVKWFRQAAEQGHAVGQADLALMYVNGQGTAKDVAEALKWFRKAAEQGYAPSQADLGKMYLNGLGAAKDPAEAMKWFRAAADQESAAGQFGIADLCDRGVGVAKDEVEAIKWYRKAAELGHVAAQNNLGVKYKAGQGVVKDEVEAVKLFRKAADAGLAQAQFNLAGMYEEGRGGLAQDLEEAVVWFRRAADQGNQGARDALKRLSK